ncbi:hypothetical protein SERLA73DRAFT_99105 [Serpula lacrymans var. lacrymans S7.3]|uniref:tRNA ligase n=2 Tax=Serpula lacrymans var. lacrymans TaxID=341189 RepID=F8QGM2_SERL3|nr:uncharacterized protein SERLADRAFT_412866 [Serpula lacrymans var. lacrymans S7.9]EGN92568.1 hypothetical protein SERLA73DRAFT_99105 [Serpula lacrymans var. lacrymans S7.3]EGO29316.1 hypothetical protein SERLADRAFT_412866 [Serpula lacrymans var. lacrymans S7.9]
MTPPCSPEDSQLIADLYMLSSKSPKLVRSSEYAAPSDPEVTVRSWKMNEFKYYDIPSPFPTLARGLFSLKLSDKNDGVDGTGKAKHRIVVRGYDKFFNIGEVPWTNWKSLEAYTGSPYTLTLKSNGCIIFIAALTPSKLLVTSKHSLGPVKGVTESHSEAGHRWLRRHLADKGKTEEQFASTLWEKNWTAIAELCDDSFEEHVLPYSSDKSGLHLHGFNETTKAFRTLPTTAVDAFADEWGFIKTASIELQTIPEVKAFTDKIGETGKWNDEALEGFVVRTHISVPTHASDRNTTCPPPYPAGSSFFFKVKFDEPYMMYRDWREITKILLNTKGSLQDAKLPRSKLKRPETKVYIKWVKEEISKNRGAFSEYTKGKGIISTREKFLRWLEDDGGKTDLSEIKESAASDKAFGKTIIVPIAIPGCGKTTVAVALAHLFKFGHTQSDDVQAKKPAPIFIKNVVELLKLHDVVIADKNNHLVQHREQLREAVSHMDPPVRLLALNWALDEPPATIQRICGDRVFSRGDNHQSLRADKITKSHEDAIWQFLKGYEELSDNEMDVTIEMNVEETPEQAIRRAVDGCVDILGLERPSEEKISEAAQLAMGYVPRSKKPDDKKKKKKSDDDDATPRYFGLLAEVDLVQSIGEKLREADDVPESGKALWEQLVSDKRVAGRPHVTIVHRNTLPAEYELWERCSALHRTPAPPLFKFNLGHLVWNERVMAITVDDLEVDTDALGHTDDGQEGHEFVSKLPEEVRGRMHITVGTRDANVLPIEGKSIVEAWRKNRGDGVESMELEGIHAKGRIKGLQY